jgi:uncharacterized protein YjbJ (UPF0337 family)
MGSTKDKAKGKANELAGKVTGNKTREAKGKAQRQKGRIKDEAEAEKQRTKRDVRKLTGR